MSVNFNKALQDRDAAFLSHCRPVFLEWLRGQQWLLTPAVLEAAYKQLDGMNSYERELLYDRMDDRALCTFAAKYLKHCSQQNRRRPASSYDDSIIGDFAPLLIDRLRRAAGVADDEPALYSPPVRKESL